MDGFFHVDTLRRLKSNHAMELKDIEEEFDKNIKSKANKILRELSK